MIQEYEARIAALERLVGKQALELEFQKGALRDRARHEFTVTDRGDPDNCTPVSVSCTAALASLEHTVTITVNPVNDAPTATDGTASLDEEARPITIDLRARGRRRDRRPRPPTPSLPARPRPQGR